MRLVYVAAADSIHTRRWAQHFAARGNDVTVVSFPPGEIPGVKVIHVGLDTLSPRRGIVSRLGKVRKLLRNLPADIFHAHYVTSYGFVAALSHVKPLVITAWGTDVLIRPERSFFYRQIVRFALSQADLVTSMGEHMTRLLLDRRYVPIGKVLTLPFGVDTALFNLEAPGECREGKPALVVSTRRLEPALDVETLIRAVPLVLCRIPNVNFLVASEGSHRSYLETLAVQLGVEARVWFVGPIEHVAMARFLRGADVFVSTSPSDGNNVSLNEAMACGTFPIVTDIPANRAFVENEQNGLSYPCGSVQALASCIIRAVNMPEWRRSVRELNYRIVAERASWQRSMEIIETRYRRLIEINASRRPQMQSHLFA